MKSYLLLLIIVFSGAFTLFGQKQGTKSHYLSGRVVDASDNPVSNVVILLNGRKVDQTTDSRGFYRVRVRPGDTLITVFVINGGMKEEIIKGRDVINFVLGASLSAQPSTPAMKADEQEVNVGYGTVKRKNLTTSVGKIDGSNKKYASYSNIYDMIKGEVPGVQVSGKKITIQGPTSFYAGTDPLILVNGIETSSIEDIPPVEVKSIEVLKGPSASIYGSRGSNGVILITLFGSEKK